MRAGNINAKSALGFLTVVDHPQHGLFGGYLLLNLLGRPLEFHCTAPVKANRAQQILYGPTLEAFLYGEQIGATLIGQGRIEPLVVCTDREAVLAVRPLVSAPVALVLPGEDQMTPATQDGMPAESPAAGTSAGRTFRIDAPHPGPRLKLFSLGRSRLAVSEAAGDDRRLIVERLGESGPEVDLAEPFTRIREAIEEAQQAAR